MDLEGRIRPIDTGATKAVLVSLAAVIIAVGAAVFSFTYMLAGSDLSPAIYGMVLVWIGSMAFFYAVITEEHTMKELFIRQAYFFCGVLGMILGMFFVSLGGFTHSAMGTTAMEFGVLVLIIGAAMILLSAKRTGDYSRMSALFAMFSGVLLTIGGLLAGSLNLSYGGIFMIIMSVFWLGLRGPDAL
jgi:hypothetical protein